MSKLTEKAMAAAVMELLKTRTLDKITIHDITDSCGLTRNTFYYHFRDVYDLLRWVFEEKLREIMEQYQDNSDWEGGLEATLEYLYENRQVMLHIHQSVGYELLFRFVNEVMYHHAEVIVAQEVKGQALPEHAIRIAASLYMNAAVGDVLEWVRSGMDRTPEHMAQVYNIIFRGTIKAVLKSAALAATVD